MKALGNSDIGEGLFLFYSHFPTMPSHGREKEGILQFPPLLMRTLIP
jgi:hypothetical protein